MSRHTINYTEGANMKDSPVHTLQALAAVIGITAIGYSTSEAAAQDAWQERLLFDPPQSQLMLEKRGRVMIYDGLTDRQVARAMDTQFDRIQSMMFVRTILTNPTGDDVVEDDGCD